MSRIIADYFARLMETEGGFTFDPATKGPVTKGYAVAVRPPSGKDWRSFEPGSLTGEDIARFVFDYFGMLASESGTRRGARLVVGGWRAEDRDALDIVRVYDSRERALWQAKAAKQDAIFDLSAGEEIEVR